MKKNSQNLPVSAASSSPAPALTRAQKRKAERRMWRKLKEKHVLSRILAGILIFLLGFNSFLLFFVGGGALVYFNLSIDRVEKFTGDLGVDRVLTDVGEVDLTALSLSGWVAEVSKIVKNINSYSLSQLSSVYGIALPDSLRSAIPDGIWEMKIGELQEGETTLISVANNLPFSYFYQFFSSDFLSEPAKAVLGNRSIGLLLSGDYADFVRDTYLGYFTGCTYEMGADGTYQLVMGNAEHPTRFEALAGLELGAVLDTLLGNGDLYGLIFHQLGSVKLTDLLGDTDSAILNTLGDANTIADLFRLNESTGQYELTPASLTDDVYIGQLLGYTKQMSEDGTTLVGWLDNDGNALSKLLSTIANICLGPVLRGETSLSDIIGDLCIGDILEYTRITDAETGAVTGWLNDTGDEVNTLQNTLYSITVASFIDGTFDLDTTLDSLYLGDTQGYTKVTDADGNLIGWKDGDVTVTGLKGALANLEIVDVFNGTFNIANTLEGVYLGDAQGYRLQYEEDGTPKKDENGKLLWEKATVDPDTGVETVTPLSAFNNALAALPLSDAVRGNLDLPTLFIGMYIGDVQGYDRNGIKTSVDPEDPDSRLTYYWNETVPVVDSVTGAPVYDTDGVTQITTVTELGALENALANIPLSDAMDGKINFDTTFAGLYFGDTNGYRIKTDAETGTPVTVDGNWVWQEKITPEGGAAVWQDVSALNNTIANILLTDVLHGNVNTDALLDGLYFGDMTNYTKGAEKTGADPLDPDSYPTYYWTKANGVALNGLELAVANLKISEVTSGTFDADSIVSDLPLSDLLNMTENTYTLRLPGSTKDEVYPTPAPEGKNPGDAVTHVLYFNSDGVVAGSAVGALAGSTIDHLDTKANDTKIGALLGYISYNGTWYSYTILEEPAGDVPGVLSLSPVTGMIASFVDLSVSDMSSSTALSDAVKTVQLSDALGYTLGEDGVWYTTYIAPGDSGNVPATGVLSALADKKISEISSAVDTVCIGQVMEYSRLKNPDGTYVTDANGNFSWVDGDGNPPDATLVPFMDLTVAEMKDSDLVQDKIGTMQVSDILGYEKHDGFWYEKNMYDKENPEEGKLTNMLALIADSQIGDVSDTVNTMKMGDVFNCTYDETQGIWLNADGTPATGFVRATADILLVDIESEIGTIALGSVMGYEKHGSIWYQTYDAENPTANVAASGIVTAFVNLTVDELSNPANLTSAVQKMLLSDALGYRKVGGIWYKTYDEMNPSNNVRATGILLYLAQSNCTIENISGLLYSVPCGYALNYTKVGDAWYETYSNDGNPENDVMATGLCLAIADTRLDGLGNKIADLTLSDIFAADKFNKNSTSYSGILGLLGPSVKLSEMDTAVATLFTDTNIGDLIDAGLINDFSDDQKIVLRYAFRSDENTSDDDTCWRSKLLNDFVSGIIDLLTIPSTP